MSFLTEQMALREQLDAAQQAGNGDGAEAVVERTDTLMTELQSCFAAKWQKRQESDMAETVELVAKMHLLDKFKQAAREIAEKLCEQ